MRQSHWPVPGVIFARYFGALYYPFRAELYAKAFPKIIQEWSSRHGIAATGHQDQEEVVNPVSVSGDLMKCFKYQDIPGVDRIGGNRPAERFYKVISSAAYNWDKGLVMSETYGAMGDISWETRWNAKDGTSGSRNEHGGMAVFLKAPTARTLQYTLDRMLEVYDVEFEAGKSLRYIHKIKDGKHIFFLAHLGKTPISTQVELRGRLRPEFWNPHTGEISRPEYAHEKKGTVDVTRVTIKLAPTKSMFITAQ